MKKLLMLTVGVLLMAQAGQAGLDYSWSGALSIPNNNPAGRSFMFEISDPNTFITGVSVSFDITGGYNGDLYAYLAHGSGFAVLLDRVGTGTGSEPTFSFGYGNTGFNVTLDDTGANGIQNYQDYSYTLNGSGQLTGTWKPNDGSTSFGDTFHGMDPNGIWTLFFADRAGGDNATIMAFSVNIAAVPEPTTWAMVVFAAIILGAHLSRKHWTALQRRRSDG